MLLEFNVVETMSLIKNLPNQVLVGGTQTVLELEQRCVTSGCMNQSLFSGDLASMLP